MSFALTVNGHCNDPATAEGEEQKLIDALRTLIAEHADKITYAQGTFEYQGSVDLLLGGTGPIVQPDPNVTPPPNPPAVDPPAPTPEPVPAPVPAPAPDPVPAPAPAPVPAPEPQPTNPDGSPIPAPDAPPVNHGDLVVKIPGETYHDYVDRAAAAGIVQVLGEQDWLNLP